MEKYIVVFELSAQAKIRAHYNSSDKSVIKKSEKILFELTETPFSSSVNP